MSGEKTEDASQKKLNKARKDGKVAKSQEFTSTAVAVAALAALIGSSSTIGVEMIGLLEQTIKLAMRPELDKSVISPFMFDGLMALFRMLAPVLGVSFVVAAFVSYIQIGPVFSIKPLIPDANRLNIANGFKNLFNKDKLVELAKNMGKISVMGVVGFVVFVDQLEHVIRSPRLRLIDGMQILGESASSLAQFLVGGLIAFAILDLLWQRHKFKKEMMMSKQEVKDEYKESEGSPEMKGKRKQFHRELLQGGAPARVKNADAVVTNPTHIAVALAYNEEEMGAPQVLAKGRGEVAAEMRKLARRYNVPIVRDVPLARALVDVDDDNPIPEDLYEPVAEVLRYVYSLGER